MDVRNPDAVKAAFDACEAKFGLPSIVINNAAGNFISVSYDFVFRYMEIDKPFLYRSYTLIAFMSREIIIKGTIFFPVIS